MANDNHANAAAAPPSVSEHLAKCLQTVETLTNVFGFDLEVAKSAVDTVGPDATACYNFILDESMAEDKGGPIYPIDNCPHLERHCKIATSQIPKHPMQVPCCGGSGSGGGGGVAGLKGDTEMDGSCPLGENWLCLQCGKVHCSRYVNGHCVDHWKYSKTSDDNEGHCIAISFADLSVWCHECQSYIRNDHLLTPLLKQLEHYKFSKEESVTNNQSNNDNNNNNNNYSDNGDREYSVDERDYTNRKDPPRFSPGDFDAHPPTKKQRSVSSLDSSINSSVSSKTSLSSTSEEVEPSNNDKDDEFDRETKIRSFPISLDDEGEEEERVPIEYPFGTLPTSLKDVADFILSDKCRSVVILAGAGMSVVSGIPDFRSANGLYATMDPDSLTATQTERDLIRMDPSIALDNHLFLQNQLPCLEVNRQFLLGTKDQVWKATLAHRFVELLHRKTNKLIRLYTQNIDGLEDQCNDLPRDKIVNVHGSMDQAECGMCRSEVDFETFCTNVRHKIKDITGTDPTAPTASTYIECPICGYNALKPAIVLFKSNLPQRFFELASNDVENADLLLILGTSLRVAPANSLIYRVPRTCLRVLVNRDPVGIHLGIQYGPMAERDYFAPGDIDATMLELMAQLGWLDELEPLLNNQLPESSSELLRKRLELERQQTNAMG